MHVRTYARFHEEPKKNAPGDHPEEVLPLLVLAAEEKKEGEKRDQLVRWCKSFVCVCVCVCVCACVSYACIVVVVVVVVVV